MNGIAKFSMAMEMGKVLGLILASPLSNLKGIHEVQ